VKKKNFFLEKGLQYVLSSDWCTKKNLMVYGETGRPYLYQHEIKDFKFLEYWLLNVKPMLDISGLSYV
jgi:hypothetical protein